ncbi:MAG: hypothetical protein ACP5KN_14210 [Armatimonadota bacterium]
MRRLIALMTIVGMAAVASVAFAQQNQQVADEEKEEEPYDERGFIKDNMRISLSLTKGSNEYYDYDDLRVYFTGNAHYALKGDDFIDGYLLIDKLDREYSEERFQRGDIRNVFDAEFTYVFGGVDKWTYGLSQAAGLLLFSDDMWEDVDLGLGYGARHNYGDGDLKLLGGMGRNLGRHDDWSPLLDFTWTHDQRLGSDWRVRTKADWMWAKDRADENESIYLLDGMLTYEVVKGWSVYLRYFNDNSSDRSRSYVSLGLSHYFRARRPRGR